MPRAAQTKLDKIEHPQSHYATPDELIEDRALSFEEKLDALKIWEQDARQMLTASNEGMPGSDEGIEPSNHHMLGMVERARDKLQGSPKLAASRRGGEESLFPFYCCSRAGDGWPARLGRGSWSGSIHNRFLTFCRT